ncbi:MAG: sulfotransferase domain-containing protein [Sphingobacteriales bacterium]|nr:sulfotransferase domain-containing protein [Sphingobacteriales bacterium]
MPLPNFLIIGAAKSGTSSLYIYLREHPEIFMSPVKETRFFSVMNQNIDFNDPASAVVWKGTVSNFEDYKKLFDGVKKEKAIGEASPLYMHTPEAAQNIKSIVPDTKIIACLRQPVERAYSHYWHFVKLGFEKNPTFEAAIADDAQRNYAEYLQLGLYYKMLKRYYDIFDHDKIRIYLYEDLSKDPKSLLKDMFRFLEVDDSFMPNVEMKYNTFAAKREKNIPSASTSTGWLQHFTSLFKKNPPAAVAAPQPQKPRLSEDTFNNTIVYFKEDIQQLQNLLGRDLSQWLLPKNK